jgi:hypothetical protein
MRKAFGSGVATIAKNGDLLDCWFLKLDLKPLLSPAERSGALDEDLDREAYLHQESDAEYSDEDVMIEKDLDNWI